MKIRIYVKFRCTGTVNIKFLSAANSEIRDPVQRQALFNTLTGSPKLSALVKTTTARIDNPSVPDCMIGSSGVQFTVVFVCLIGLAPKKIVTAFFWSMKSFFNLDEYWK